MTKTKSENIGDIAIIGGGPAGMVAAIRASWLGANVTLFEKNKILGKKLRITGKGRCNVTNACTVPEFLNNIPVNSKFLWSAVQNFPPDETMKMFESLGVPLKVERGKRVFPVSDKAGDIAGALVKQCHENNIHIIHEKVTAVSASGNHVWQINTHDSSYTFRNVIICTGGLSYPLTGSDGDGYRFAENIGHSIIPLLPSLVPIVCEGKECAKMQGLSLRNVRLKIRNTASRKIIYDDFGEMMFTHFGITGPIVLSASAHLHDIKTGKYTAVIDLKPALDNTKLDFRILSDFSKYANRDFDNSLGDLLPQKMIPVVIARSEINPHKKVNSISREERRKLVDILKNFEVKLRCFRPIDEAIVTRGGIDVKQINPKTMESKLFPGLFFAGEIIDVDGYTGGFNLQIAFSTGILAGENAASSQINNI